MKKVIDYISITLVIVCGVLMLCRIVYTENSQEYKQKHLYSKVVTVTEINRYADFVTVEDVNDKQYHFYWAREYSIGDIALVIFSDAGTKFKFDDYMVSHTNIGGNIW